MNFYERFKKMNYYTRCPLKWKWAADGRRFDPRVRQHSFVEIGHGIICTAIISLALIQVGQFSITGEKMCTCTIKPFLNFHKKGNIQWVLTKFCLIDCYSRIFFLNIMNNKKTVTINITVLIYHAPLHRVTYRPFKYTYQISCLMSENKGHLNTLMI